VLQGLPPAGAWLRAGQGRALPGGRDAGASRGACGEPGWAEGLGHTGLPVSSALVTAVPHPTPLRRALPVGPGLRSQSPEEAGEAARRVAGAGSGPRRAGRAGGGGPAAIAPCRRSGLGRPGLNP